jgi:hypothetical protein
MKFNALNQKRHSQVEARISKVDDGLRSIAGSASTWFESIGEDERSCKVRSFGVGERLQDHLFRTIFDVESPKVGGEYQTHSGVKKWSPDLQREANEAKESMRLDEDICVQEDVMGADPGAFQSSDALVKCKAKHLRTVERLCEELGSRTLELQSAQTELVVLRMSAGKLKEMEDWYRIKQEELAFERRRIGRVLSGSELPARDEEIAGLRAEIVRVKAESEANVSGLVSVRMRDSKIAELEKAAVKQTQRLENANKAVDEANHKVSIMEDVVCELGGPDARKEISKRMKGVYYNVGDLWEGNSCFLDETTAAPKKKRKSRTGDD